MSRRRVNGCHVGVEKFQTDYDSIVMERFEDQVENDTSSVNMGGRDQSFIYESLNL